MTIATYSSSHAIPVLYMRGGTSKGAFFLANDLPVDPFERDALLLRIMGSPDPYGKQMDGLGGASSSTSKVVILSPSSRPGYAVDYLFGAVAIDTPLIDWSGNCGNLSAAVGPAALMLGLVPAIEGHTEVVIWQVNIGQRIVARVPVQNGLVVEQGSFQEDGVAFSAAEIELAFYEPPLQADALPLLPTGNVVDELMIPNLGSVAMTLITAGNPTVFVKAQDLGLTGRETQAEILAQPELMQTLETIRAYGALAMGLGTSVEQISRERPGTPKIAWLGAPQDYVDAAGKTVKVDSIDLVARIMSMGKPHHAFTGTGSIALAVAAAIPGTLVEQIRGADYPTNAPVRFGHASGVLRIGATARYEDDHWRMEKALLSRSARRLMQGLAFVPQ